MEWQNLSLSKELRKRLNDAEVQVFSDFEETLQKLQKQLYSGYNHYQYLRDRLLTAIDVPSLQDPLRDRMQRTAQQLIQRTMR